MKKLFFPFYKSRHHFLVQKWWFRAIMLAYLVWSAVSPFKFGFGYLSANTSWCYDSLYLYSDNMKEWSKMLHSCSEIARETWPAAIGVGLIGAIGLYYLIQFLFFKVLVDFVVLGTSFKKE